MPSALTGQPKGKLGAEQLLPCSARAIPDKYLQKYAQPSGSQGRHLGDHSIPTWIQARYIFSRAAEMMRPGNRFRSWGDTVYWVSLLAVAPLR